jgi:hypothetical protein
MILISVCLFICLLHIAATFSQIITVIQEIPSLRSGMTKFSDMERKWERENEHAYFPAPIFLYLFYLNDVIPRHPQGGEGSPRLLDCHHFTNIINQYQPIPSINFNI